MSRSDALEFIEHRSNHFRMRLKRNAFLWSLLFFLLAIMLFNSILWVAVVLVFLGIAQIAVFFIVPDDTDRLIQLATDQPDNVVWVYPMEWSISPFGVYLFRRIYLKVYFFDGHLEDIRIPPQDTEQWMRWVNVLFSSASFGFTEERSQLFKNDPESLRQDKDPFNQS